MAIKVRNEIFLNVSESAKMVGRADNTVYQMYKKWKWPSYKYGSTLMFKETDIQKWLDNQLLAVNS